MPTLKYLVYGHSGRSLSWSSSGNLHFLEIHLPPKTLPCYEKMVVNFLDVDNNILGDLHDDCFFLKDHSCCQNLHEPYASRLNLKPRTMPSCSFSAKKTMQAP